jgi:hypothetical protein
MKVNAKFERLRRLREELISSYPEDRRLLDSTYEEAVRTLNCELNKELLKSRIGEILECIAGLREDILSRPREQVVVSRPTGARWGGTCT